jgi:hypothetical protein
MFFTGPSRVGSTADSTRSRSSSASRRRTTFPADLAHPDFPTLCGHLNGAGVDYLVIGGWAAIAHGIPRTTLDVDIFVRPDLANIRKLVAALSQVGFGIAREIDADEILRRHVYLFADQIRIDVFTKPWGLNDFEACWGRRCDTLFQSVHIPILGIEDLIRSKNTDREQDQEDRAALQEIARRGAGRA